MFAKRLSALLNGLLPTKTKYITVSASAVTSGSSVALLPEKMPAHVGIIMDGNGRWAQSRGLPRSAGHAAGTENLREIIRASDEWGIKALTIYAFSTENWARSHEEVEALMGLLLKYFTSEIDELHAKKVCIRILGNVEELPSAQRDAVIKAMEKTCSNTGLKLNIALNYGGREELVRAAKNLAQMAAQGQLDPADIDAQHIEDQLYTAGLPPVDLLIRTSGEMRLSNFLPWQTVYSELIFNKVYWPDYDRAHFFSDLRTYQTRDRRFGKVKTNEED